MAGTACFDAFAPTPASKDGRASLGGHNFGLVGHPQVQARNADRSSREVSLYSPRPNLPTTPKIGNLK